MPGVPVLGTATQHCPHSCYFWPLHRSHHHRGQQLLPFPFPFPQTRGMDGDRMRNPPPAWAAVEQLNPSGDLPLQPRFPPVQPYVSVWWAAVKIALGLS